MAYLSQESFNIPSGFAIEEIKGQLYYDDLEEDDELWLIRMPCDVELSTLDKQKIFLSDDAGDMSIKKFEIENGKSLECFVENCEISSTSVVLPKKEDGQLRAVKKVLKGAILISEGLCLNNEMEIKSEKEDGHFDDDDSFLMTKESNREKTIKRKKDAHSKLNTNELLEKYETVCEHSEDRNNSMCKKRKRKKKTHCDLNTNELEVKYENVNEYSEDSNDSTRKKRRSTKKKHLHNDFYSDDMNYETEAAESFNSPKSKKKSSKKHSSPHRKSNVQLKIKDEPMAVDFDDGYPTCNSQK